MPTRWYPQSAKRIAGVAEPLLVMLENLGEVLTRQIRDQSDVAALRKFLMADNGCLLLATAPLHFDGITDVGQPFYDFFDIQIPRKPELRGHG